MTMQMDDMEYAGFWVRLGATVLDSLLLLVITLPLSVAVYGLAYMQRTDLLSVAGPWDVIINWIAPAAATVLFWHYWNASPGKMAFRLQILDARTGQGMSTRQAIGRYFAYLVSGIPLFLGFIWVAFDPRKQGWHDKLAGTVVVRAKYRGPEPVRFDP